MGFEIMPVWTGVRRKCSKEQANEIQNRFEAKSEGVRVCVREEKDSMEMEIEIAWKEGYWKVAEGLIQLIRE